MKKKIEILREKQKDFIQNPYASNKDDEPDKCDSCDNLKKMKFVIFKKHLSSSSKEETI